LRELSIDPSYPTSEWYAVAINDSGRIGGHVHRGDRPVASLLLSDETAAPIALAMPAAFPYGEIYGINVAGVMVGVMWDDTGLEHAFVFDTTNGVRDLNELIDPASGWVLQFARDINESGQIVGSGTQAGLERVSCSVRTSRSRSRSTGPGPPGNRRHRALGRRCERPVLLPGGLSRSVTCTGSFPPGTVVELDATRRGVRVRGLVGRLLGRGRLLRDDERAAHDRRDVSAVAHADGRNERPRHRHRDQRAGRIDCGATCSAGFPTGTEVTLTATAGPHSVFAG